MFSRLAVTSRAAAAAARPLAPVVQRAATARGVTQLCARPALAQPPRGLARRRLCSETKKTEAKETPAQKAMSEEEIDDLVPLTPAQKLGVGMNLTAWAAGLSLAAVCGYYIVRELMPSKMSPNSVFDRAFEEVRKDSRIERIYGEPLKGYGRDHGGHREGRRNFIENTPYEDEADGSKRLRVRFNIKGPYGEGFVFAEISDKYDGFVYLMVQDKRTGRVVTLEDNRLSLKAMAPKSDAERSALAGLLGGSGGGPPKY
mmetsp:Transcript_25468/g.76488  ORF Transcript_25468/g.76488 Transcript_25468/m.76488 type:complete len:258 (-) Transcript_25468:40-813(-)